MREKFAAVIVILTLLAVPCAVLWYQKIYIPSQYDPEAIILDLTGFAGSGVWTMEEIRGTNYWWKFFEPAAIVLEKGQDVVLRIRSADMTHQFYLPALEIGPLTIKPGHMVEYRFKAEKTGVFKYFCTSMCDACHFYMQGWVVIHHHGERPVLPEPIICPLCDPNFPQPPVDDPLALGEYLYIARGCVTCHGVEGRGGVTNYNYIQGTVPAHNNTAEKFFLEDEEETEAFMDLLMEGADLDELQSSPPFPSFRMAIIRYKMATDIIRKGKNAARLDPAGPEPPLQMPTWGYILSDEEIDALITYFLYLYDWEYDEWEEEGHGEDTSSAQTGDTSTQ